MPLTPLHLAVGLPAMGIAKNRFSIVSFIITNCVIDIQPILVLGSGLGERFNLDVHGLSHTLLGATILAALFVGVWRIRSAAWWAGALWGAWSHVFLDAMCHDDVYPFYPWTRYNPLNLDIHSTVTLVCAGILTFYLTRWVQSLKVGERFAQWRAGSRA
jgi:membrane-bound metal-dependent hydrolase YbcI (DUF457 family)